MLSKFSHLGAEKKAPSPFWSSNPIVKRKSEDRKEVVCCIAPTKKMVEGGWMGGEWDLMQQLRIRWPLGGDGPIRHSPPIDLAVAPPIPGFLFSDGSVTACARYTIGCSAPADGATPHRGDVHPCLVLDLLHPGLLKAASIFRRKVWGALFLLARFLPSTPYFRNGDDDSRFSGERGHRIESFHNG